MKSQALIALSAVFLMASSTVAAQGKAPWQEYDKFIQSRTTVSGHGPDLFGDQINAYNNTLSFSVTDISLPGNSGLTVALTRSFNVVTRNGYGANDPSMADWELDLPRMSGVYAPAWPDQRCTSTAAPTTAYAASTAYNGYEYWQGVQADIPGGGELLVADQATPKPTAGGPYIWLTAGFTYFSCLPSIQNGTGEGFLAITADGTKYWFNWMARYSVSPLASPMTATVNPASLARMRNVLYATRVEDRFGNSVTYTYSNAATASVRLTSIQASDGRQITLGYNPQGQVASATAAGRTWTYQYAYSGATLSAVILPDASRWTIELKPLADAVIDFDGDAQRSCDRNANWLGGGGTGRVTHPSGAVGEFDVAPARFGRTNVPMFCVNWEYPVNNRTNDIAYLPRNYEVLAIAAKRVSGPGLATQQWTYSGGGIGSWAAGTGPSCQTETCMQPVCVSDSCAGSTITTVTAPGGKWTRYTFGNSYRYNEGKLLRVERGSGPTAIMETVQTGYELAQSGQPFSTPVGRSLQARSDGFTSEYLRPQRTQVITRDGSTFSSTVMAFDVFARPLSLLQSSSLGYSKTETIEYDNNTTLWVLSQVKRTTVDGIETSRTDYDPATALPIRTYSFGKPQHTLGYWAQGTLATVTDGRGYTTQLNWWKRGIPQGISFPDGTSKSAVVDDNGWITSVTDENGATTSYGHDAMGRTNRIVYPVGDSTPWNDTTITFAPVAADEYGIPAGHWRRVEQTGNSRKFTYFDALWRPIVEEVVDTANMAGTNSWVAKRYDTEGRPTFVSYPRNLFQSGWVAWASVNDGTHSSYDALGRVLLTEQDSELGPRTGTSTQYLSGLQILTTNPRGFQTTTSYRAYDQPSYDQPIQIAHPAGAFTDIVRNVFGNPTLLRRRNGDSTNYVDRHYVYNSAQELCKQIEPETGATVMEYDGANNLSWSAAGLALGNTSDCNYYDGYYSGRRVHREYDNRNRLLELQFPDANGNQTWSYTPDGLPARILTYNDGGANTTSNVYTYNKRRMLTGESGGQVGWYSWPIDYSYDGNGSLASQTYPSGLSVNYAPNALGQPTRAGSYATNVSYHPNGAMAGFTYGNGIVHTMTQNARQLPYRSTDSGGALDLQYHYDQNGNAERIYDQRNPADHRYLQYDQLDRLTAAGSAMFGGDNWHRFSYDVLDNLKSWTLGGVKDYAYYDYDPNHRLTNIRNSAGASIVGIGYDGYGNVQNKNGQIYYFDYGNRLRGVANKESYRYDGHGRRALAWRPVNGGQLTLSQYAMSGQLMYQSKTETTIESHHVYLGGSLVATREGNWSTGAVATKYQHTDALGSPVAVTNEAGQVIDRTQYEPYGGAIGKPAYDGIGYTGHAQDGASGLTYMQQRYYDPSIGRFLSVDPISADPNTGAMFNRYVYASNNPYRFIDPDGRAPQANTCSRLGSSSCGGDYSAGPPSGVHKPLSTGQAIRANFDRNVQRSPLGPGGKDAIHFLGDSMVDGIADAVDGNYKPALVNLGIGVLARPLKPLSERLTFLYQKLGPAGQHLKFGIATNPATRYTSAELAGGRLKILTSGSRADMLQLERNLHGTLPIGSQERQMFYIQQQLEKGLLAPPYGP